jgi:catechol-2,3-dioxygenase
MGGRLSTVVLETRDPQGLARFYSELLGLPITGVDVDWVDIGNPDTTRLSFQQAPEHQPPRWPDPGSSMQFHLDIDVDDIEEAEARALALGATRLGWDSATEEARGLRPVSASGFRVYADPAGHPFCLCWG